MEELNQVPPEKWGTVDTKTKRTIAMNINNHSYSACEADMQLRQFLQKKGLAMSEELLPPSLDRQWELHCARIKEKIQNGQPLTIRDHEGQINWRLNDKFIDPVLYGARMRDVRQHRNEILRALAEKGINTIQDLPNRPESLAPLLDRSAGSRMATLVSQLHEGMNEQALLELCALHVLTDGGRKLDIPFDRQAVDRCIQSYRGDFLGGCMKADRFMKQRWMTLWRDRSSYRIRWIKSLPVWIG